MSVDTFITGYIAARRIDPGFLVGNTNFTQNYGLDFVILKFFRSSKSRLQHGLTTTIALSLFPLLVAAHSCVIQLTFRYLFVDYLV